MNEFEIVSREYDSLAQHLFQEWRRALGSEDHEQHYSDNNKVHTFAGTKDCRTFTYFHGRTKTYSSTDIIPPICVQQHMLPPGFQPSLQLVYIGPTISVTYKASATLQRL